jgi:hypothetical protein
MSQPDYDLRNIHQLITEAYSLEDLRTLALYEFREVYEDYGEAKKSELVRKLIEHCERKGLLGRLLGLVKRDAAGKYGEFAGKLARGVEIGPPAGPVEPADPGSSESEQLRALIKANMRQLHELQLQEATYGLATPPHIKIQIEDLEAKIDRLKNELAALEGL